MTLDCSTLCLLAISVGLRASNDTKKCAYCLDVRALSAECDAEPLRCAYTDPMSLIYCLTIVETPTITSKVRRAVRCVSQATFNLTLNDFREAAQLRQCEFDALRDCDCPNCRPAGNERDYGEPTTTTVMTTKLKTTTKPSTTMDPMLRSLKVQRIGAAPTTRNYTTPAAPSEWRSPDAVHLSRSTSAVSFLYKIELVASMAFIFFFTTLFA